MIYALHDNDEKLKRKGAFPIKESQIKEMQDKGYGIHFTANTFNGRRKAENIKDIRFWLADCDDGTKEEQMLKIKSLPLIPSVIVETKRGYHCYWKAKDATIEKYREIQTGIIKKLGSDPACKDVCRMLRMPNTLHLKDPKNPFVIKIVEDNKKEYTQGQMLLAYELPKPRFKPVKYDGDKSDLLNPEKWEKIFKISSFMAEGRNNSLARICLWLRDSGFNPREIENTIMGINSMIQEPLEQWEVKTILRGKI